MGWVGDDRERGLRLKGRVKGGCPDSLSYSSCENVGGNEVYSPENLASGILPIDPSFSDTMGITAHSRHVSYAMAMLVPVKKERPCGA
jgi:hypothetical protein